MSHVVYAIARKDIGVLRNEDGTVELDVDPEKFKYLYVGMTHDFEKRMGEHKTNAVNKNYKTSQKLYRRLCKYGWDAFDKVILASDLSLHEAKVKETELIAKYNSFKLGLNSTPGGDGVGWGGEHHNATAVVAFNNSTKEMHTFDCLKAASKFLGIKQPIISNILAGKYKQSFSDKHDAFFQFKHKGDTSSFDYNMPTPKELASGTNSYHAFSIKAFNMTTKEIIVYECGLNASKDTGIQRSHISSMINGTLSHAYSKVYKAWFQFKKETDETPFVENMPTRYEKQGLSQSGGKNHAAIPVCVFGKLYPAASMASETLRTIYNLKKNFVSRWIHRTKNPEKIFKVSKEFYELYKDVENVTKEMYDKFVKIKN